MFTLVTLFNRRLGYLSLCSFFFQAEDGIRDPLVTGVQTCALPISRGRVSELDGPQRSPRELQLRRRGEPRIRQSELVTELPARSFRANSPAGSGLSPAAPDRAEAPSRCAA